MSYSIQPRSTQTQALPGASCPEEPKKAASTPDQPKALVPALTPSLPVPSNHPVCLPDRTAEARQQPVARQDASERLYGKMQGSPLQRSGLVPEQIQLKGVQSIVQSEIRQLATEDPKQFAAVLNQVYKGKLDEAQMGKLLEGAKNGTWPQMPEVKFVDRSVLTGQDGKAANGAYHAEPTAMIQIYPPPFPLPVQGTIYLNRDLLKDPEQLKATLREELGHHIDQTLGGKDTRGDEGEHFALALEKGAPLHKHEAALLRKDKDQGTITVDGKQLKVEFDKGGADSQKAAKTIVKSYKNEQKAAVAGNRPKYNKDEVTAAKGMGTALASGKIDTSHFKQVLTGLKEQIAQVRHDAGMPVHGNSAHEKKAQIAALIIEGYAQQKNGSVNPQELMDNVMKPLFGADTEFLWHTLADQLKPRLDGAVYEQLRAPLKEQVDVSRQKDRAQNLANIVKNLPAWEQFAAGGTQFDREITQITMQNTLKYLREIGKPDAEGKFADQQIQTLYNRTEEIWQKLGLMDFGKKAETVLNTFGDGKMEKSSAREGLQDLLRDMRLTFPVQGGKVTHPPKFVSPEVQNMYAKLTTFLLGYDAAKKEGVGTIDPSWERYKGIDPNAALAQNKRPQEPGQYA